jgi:hypothetical protein
MDGYSLTKKFFAYAYEDHKIKPPHVAVYYWVMHRANESGWKKVIDIQTEKSMDVLGITDWRTYKNALQYLHDCGLIVWVEKSKNQYTCNRISLTDKSLAETDAYKLTAFLASAKDVEAIVEAIVKAQPEASVKAIAEALQLYINNKTDKPKTDKPQGDDLPDDGFDEWWNKYGKKIDVKKCRNTWKKLSKEQRAHALNDVAKYVEANPDPKYRKNPLTYLNGECWNDEIPISIKAQVMTAASGLSLPKAIEQQSRKTYR